MSGKPSKEGVEEFTIYLKRLSDATQEVIRLGKEIESNQRKYEEQEVLRKSAQKELFDLMSEMDIQANHNAGWEGRITSFYLELYRQTKQ